MIQQAMAAMTTKPLLCSWTGGLCLHMLETFTTTLLCVCTPSALVLCPKHQHTVLRDLSLSAYLSQPPCQPHRLPFPPSAQLPGLATVMNNPESAAMMSTSRGRQRDPTLTAKQPCLAVCTMSAREPCPKHRERSAQGSVLVSTAYEQNPFSRPACHPPLRPIHPPTHLDNGLPLCHILLGVFIPSLPLNTLRNSPRQRHRQRRALLLHSFQ
jgi:hypothetical protein